MENHLFMTHNSRQAETQNRLFLSDVRKKTIKSRFKNIKLTNFDIVNLQYIVRNSTPTLSEEQNFSVAHTACTATDPVAEP
jgi:hypothetical protein